MGLVHEVVYMRDYMKLSWRKIVRILYPNVSSKEESRLCLKLNGLYKWYKNYSPRKIIANTTIAPHGLSVDLVEERDHLIKLYTYEKDPERRRQVYCRLNLVKARIAFSMVCDRLGLRQRRDQAAAVFERLKDRVDWGKDHIKIEGSIPIYVSCEAAALILTSLILVNLPAHKIRQGMELILGFTTGRSRKKKKEKILREMKEKFGDVLVEYYLNHIF